MWTLHTQSSEPWDSTGHCEAPDWGLPWQVQEGFSEVLICHLASRKKSKNWLQVAHHFSGCGDASSSSSPYAEHTSLIIEFRSCSSPSETLGLL